MNKSIAQKVLQALEKQPHQSFRIKELAALARVKKHNYRELKDTLIELVKQERIQRHNKTYRHKRNAAKAQSAKKSADSTPQSKADSKPRNTLMVEGRLDATPLARNHAFAFVICEGDEDDVFVSEEDLGDALHNDRVLVELAYRRGKRRHGIIREVVKRARSRFVGNLEKHRQDVYFVADDPRVHRTFLVRDLLGARTGQKVMLNVVNWGLQAQHARPAGDVVEILGEAGDPQVEVLGVIRQYDLPLEFPRKVLAEADALPDSPPAKSIKGRLDLRQTTSFTIDPVSAKDFDDALCLEKTADGWRLYVHIADVAHWVRPGSLLFREAENRGNSFYFPKTVIPMLPQKISNKLCSLRPHEDKLCLTVISEMDSRFNIRKQNVHETVIRSSARLTYEEVDDLFAEREHEIPDDVVSMLRGLRKLSDTLNKRRRARGCLWFDMPDTEYQFDDKGYLTALGRSMETESHKLVENCMLIANEYTATILTKKAPATLYRIHEDPVVEKVRKAVDTIQCNGFKVEWHDDVSKTLQSILMGGQGRDFHRVFDPLLLRTMMKARYSTDHIGHFGLAMDTYTHFTSPIRRLCDLIVHLQIKQHVLGGRGASFSTARLRELAERNSGQELLAQESEREVNRVNERQFIRRHIGDEFEALIVHITRATIIFDLDEYPVRGVIRTADLEGDHYRFLPDHVRLVGRRTGSVFKLMDRARVRIERVDDEVFLSLVEPPKEKPEIRSKKRGRKRKKKQQQEKK
ncbi:MAG: ribonuclease R [Candidatus Cloacimonetes bacterium]|nr:ribonuclease R [Candidatus Cloacimonadota bacterium]